MGVTAWGSRWARFCSYLPPVAAQTFLIGPGFAKGISRLATNLRADAICWVDVLLFVMGRRRAVVAERS